MYLNFTLGFEQTSFCAEQWKFTKCVGYYSFVLKEKTLICLVLLDERFVSFSVKYLNEQTLEMSVLLHTDEKV